MNGMGDAMSVIRQAQHAREVIPPRMADAQAVLDLVARYDHRYAECTPEWYHTQLEEWTIQISNSNLSLAHLLAGVRRWGGQKKRGPWMDVGDVLDEARAARQLSRQGGEVRALRALPAAPPASGPVAGAYGASLGHECPRCGAGVGEPCVNSKTGDAKRAPCVGRLVASRT